MIILIELITMVVLTIICYRAWHKCGKDSINWYE